MGNIIKHKIKETHTYYNRPIMKLAFLSTLLRGGRPDRPEEYQPVVRQPAVESTDDKVWHSPIVFSGTCVKSSRSGKCGEITLWHIFKGDEQLTSTMVRNEIVDGFEQKQLFNLNADNSEAHVDETRIFFAEIDNGQVKLINKEENVYLDRLKRVTKVANFQKKNPHLTMLEAINAPLNPALNLEKTFEPAVDKPVVQPEVISPDSSSSSDYLPPKAPYDPYPSYSTDSSSDPEVVEPEVETIVKTTEAPVVTDAPTPATTKISTTTKTTPTAKSTTKSTTTSTETTTTTTTTTSTTTTSEPVTVIDIKPIVDNERQMGDLGDSERSDYDFGPTEPLMPMKGASDSDRSDYGEPDVPMSGGLNNEYGPTVPPRSASTTYLPEVPRKGAQESRESGFMAPNSASNANFEPSPSGPPTSTDPIIIYPDEEMSSDYASDDEDEDPLQRSARHKNMRFFANEDEWLNAINET